MTFGQSDATAMKQKKKRQFSEDQMLILHPKKKRKKEKGVTRQHLAQPANIGWRVRV